MQYGVKVLEARSSLDTTEDPFPWVFLAGLCDWDIAGGPWREQVAARMRDRNVTVTLIDPTRRDWAEAVEPPAGVPDKPPPQYDPFEAQVNWEMLALELSHMRLIYFGDTSSQATTMFELAVSLMMGPTNTYVVAHCKHGLFHYIRSMAERFRYRFFTDLFEASDALGRRIEEACSVRTAWPNPASVDTIP